MEQKQKEKEVLFKGEREHETIYCKFLTMW